MSSSAAYRSDLRTYLVGLTLAVLLSTIPFALVAGTGLGRTALLWVIGVCALPQVLVHFRCFLHIDLSRQKRDDLQLILFSTMIVLLMVSGTIWIMWSAHHLMM